MKNGPFYLGALLHLGSNMWDDYPDGRDGADGIMKTIVGIDLFAAALARHCSS